MYMIAAEKLDLPLNISSAPGHLFIFWCSDTVNFFWETLYDTVYAKQDYIKNHSICRKNIDNGLYLDVLSRKQVKAVYLNLLSSFILDNKKSIE